jgi:hypothetical protein
MKPYYDRVRKEWFILCLGLPILLTLLLVRSLI